MPKPEEFKKIEEAAMERFLSLVLFFKPALEKAIQRFFSGPKTDRTARRLSTAFARQLGKKVLEELYEDCMLRQRLDQLHLVLKVMPQDELVKFLQTNVPQLNLQDDATSYLRAELIRPELLQLLQDGDGKGLSLAQDLQVFVVITGVATQIQRHLQHHFGDGLPSPQKSSSPHQPN